MSDSKEIKLVGVKHDEPFRGDHSELLVLVVSH